MKIPIGNTNNIGEQRDGLRGSMKNNSIIVIGMEERKEVPCLCESARECTRAIDRRPLIASRQRRKIGALVGRGRGRRRRQR